MSKAAQQQTPMDWSQPPPVEVLDPQTKTGRASVIDDLPDRDQLPALAGGSARGRSDIAEMFDSIPEGKARNLSQVIKDAQFVGSKMGRRAIYSWTQGGSVIEGPTVKLMYALAQVWGHNAVQVRMTERTPTKARFLGRFIDAINKTVVEREYQFSLSPPPGKFASKADQRQRWETIQEQSAASKAVRGVMEAGIPEWLVDAAVQSALSSAENEALRGRTLAEAIPDCLLIFKKDYGVTKEQMEARCGRPSDVWSVRDIITFRELYANIKNGDILVSEAFPAEDEETSK